MQNLAPSLLQSRLDFNLKSPTSQGYALVTELSINLVIICFSFMEKPVKGLVLIPGRISEVFPNLENICEMEIFSLPALL